MKHLFLSLTVLAGLCAGSTHSSAATHRNMLCKGIAGNPDIGEVGGMSGESGADACKKLRKACYEAGGTPSYPPGCMTDTTCHNIGYCPIMVDGGPMVNLDRSYHSLDITGVVDTCRRLPGPVSSWLNIPNELTYRMSCTTYGAGLTPPM